MRGVLGILFIVVGLEVAYLVLAGKLPLASGSNSKSSGSTLPPLPGGIIAGAGAASGLLSASPGTTGSNAPGDIRPYMFLQPPTLGPVTGVPLSQWKGLAS